MTTTAITQGFRICQSNLGVKIHDVKDPGQHLGPMFRQVLSALFSLMERHASYWKKVSGSEPVETFGFEGALEPEPVKVNLDLMIDLFKTGYQQFAPIYRDVFSEENFAEINKAACLDAKEFYLPTAAWLKILYELAATYRHWSINRNKLLDIMTPLYFARVASFVRQSWSMSSLEAEALVEEQAQQFEEQKEYLIRVWDEKAELAAKAEQKPRIECPV
ncbi:MAG: hypothetical protein MUD16_18550 [Desulfobacterales bacterium]|nr:hypothetical protein [Desulfobacterales bacterium]